MRPSFLFFAAFLGGCGTTSASSSLDARIVEAMKAGSKVEIELGSGGLIKKIEVYHQDPGQTPEAIRKLAEEQLKDGKIKFYEYEILADGSEVFEVEATMPDGLTCEVSGTREGRLLYRECQIAPDKAPENIRKAALAVVSGEIVEIERKEGPGIEEYGIEIRAADGLYKIKINAGGQVTARYRKIPTEIELPLP